MSNRITLALFFLSCLLTGCAITDNSNTDPYSIKNTRTLRDLKHHYSQWKNTPYRYGAQGRDGIDCSGFVQLTFKQKFKINLPRSTQQQASVGKSVNKNKLAPGDLVFFKIGRNGSTMHVGIHESDYYFIHASTSKGVIRSSLNDEYWQKHYWQARRVL